MKLNIITEQDSWIFRRMAEEIIRNCGGTIDIEPDPTADVNFFINYGFYEPVDTKTAAWFTHPDPLLKPSQSVY